MQLQKIELPKEYESDREQLYLHGNQTAYRIDGDRLIIAKGQTVSFDTYFNAFSAVKWSEYTVIDSVCFRIKAKGRGVISIREMDSECKKITEICIDSEDTLVYSTDIDLAKHNNGILFVKIDSKEEIVMYDAAFETDMTPVRDVFISLIICTYRREEYVKRNLHILQKEVTEGSSVLKSHLNVKVIDNGNTLENIDVPGFISLIPNKNAGGVGGFTRGMMCAKEEGTATHVLLMDDDVEIKISALEKTFILLSYVKDEYRDIIVGGAMLRNDCQYIQHEAGAWYQEGRFIKSRNRGLDLRKFENVCLNEKEEMVDYNAWWYCCMPVGLSDEIGLPLPLFIHFDDLEYGIRAKKRVVLMNGICVWHNTFENKRPSVNEYYDVRNNLIINALHAGKNGRSKAVKIVNRRLLTNLFRYRYKDMSLVNMAVDDFFCGPQSLKCTDPQKFHKELCDFGYRYTEEFDGDLKEFDSKSTDNSVIDRKKLLSLNGWLLPAKHSKKTVPIASGESPHRYYRVKKVWIYDPDTQKGFYSGKETGKLFVCFGMMIRQTVRLILFYGTAKKRYSKQFKDITGEAFWKEYLNI